MWRIARRTFCGLLATVLFFLAAASVCARERRQPSLGRGTWYEFLLKKCNPGNFDYGAWLEKKREAFLEASVKEPRFWYGLWTMSWSLLVTAAYAKRCLDHRREMRAAAEMLADISSHDCYSREKAREAIERHNRHIEQCNRAMETAGRGEALPGWGRSEADSLRAELQRVASQLEATTQERNKLQEELRQRALIVADLSTRLDMLSKKVGRMRAGDSGTPQAESTAAHGDNARFLGHINRLQEELYVERQKNKRLKGV